MIVKTERFEYAICWPDDVIEAGFGSEATARSVLTPYSDAKILVRTISTTEWLEVPE